MADPLSPNAPSVMCMIENLQSAICTHTGRMPFGLSAETVFDLWSTTRNMSGPGIFAESIESGYPAAIEAGGAQQVTPAAVLGSLGTEDDTSSAIGKAFRGDVSGLVEAGFTEDNARLLIDRASSLESRIPQDTDGHPLVWFEGIDQQTGELSDILVSPICSTKVLQELHARLSDRTRAEEDKPPQEKKRTEIRHTLAISVGGAKPQNSGHLAYKRTRSTRYGQYRAFRFRMPSLWQTISAQMIRRVMAIGSMFAACDLTHEMSSDFLNSVEKTWSGSAAAFPGLDGRAKEAKDYEARQARRLVQEFVSPLETLGDILSGASPSLRDAMTDRLPDQHLQYLIDTNTRVNGQADPDLVFQAMKSLTRLLVRAQRIEASKRDEEGDPFIRPSTLSALRLALSEAL